MGGSFNDRNGVHNFALVHEGTWTVNTTDHVSYHTSLVTAKRSEVAWSIGSVLGEVANATLVALGALLTARNPSYRVGLASNFR
jgi:hypothetical protein